MRYNILLSGIWCFSTCMIYILCMKIRSDKNDKSSMEQMKQKVSGNFDWCVTFIFGFCHFVGRIHGFFCSPDERKQWWPWSNGWSRSSIEAHAGNSLTANRCMWVSVMQISSESCTFVQNCDFEVKSSCRDPLAELPIFWSLGLPLSYLLSFKSQFESWDDLLISQCVPVNPGGQSQVYWSGSVFLHVPPFSHG